MDDSNIKCLTRHFPKLFEQQDPQSTVILFYFKFLGVMGFLIKE